MTISVCSLSWGMGQLFMMRLRFSSADPMRHQNASSTFVLSTVVAITLLSGLTSLSLASRSELTEPQKRILDTTNNTWLMGTGAIFGLLGSSTINSADQSGNQSDNKPGNQSDNQLNNK